MATIVSKAMRMRGMVRLAEGVASWACTIL
jgi:hypothetical protein